VLAEEIKKRMLAAMKGGRTVEKQVLGVALGDIQTQEARGSGPLSDEEAANVVRKLVKSNRETLAQSENEEQKRTLEEEIRVLEELLPKTLGVDEIVTALAPVADQVKAAGNDGQATGVAMKHLKAEGLAVNGKDVATAVKSLRAAAGGSGGPS
jgi:uncharacterized protein YqeY